MTTINNDSIIFVLQVQYRRYLHIIYDYRYGLSYLNINLHRYAKESDNEDVIIIEFVNQMTRHL